MSQENVDVVRTWFEAWNATGELDLSFFHPGLVYHPRGLVVREHDFQDRGEALQAAGLAE